MSSKKIILLISIIAALVLAGFAVWFFTNREDTVKENSGAVSESKMSKQEAIDAAKQYQPSGNCTQVMTPAVHTETGARHTFSSGCIAPGWEREASGS